MFDKKEYMKEYMNKYNLKNKEYLKKYYQKNKKRIRKKNKEYLKNPQTRKKHLEQMRQHIQKPQFKEYLKEHNKQRRKKDPTFLLHGRIRNLLSQALNIYSKTGKIKHSCEYGVDYQEIIEHLKPFPKPMKKYCVDHIIPLSWFNHNNPQEIKWAWEPTNFQWLTKQENLWKGNRFIWIKN